MQKGRILQVGTPAEVYRRPRSRAVATFIGETNLFKARGRRRVDRGRVGSTARSARWSPRPIGPSRPRRAATSGSRSARSASAPRPRRRPSTSCAARRDDDGYLYLGEIAERKLRIGDASLTSYELNPNAARARPPQPFEVAPEDVVLLPADDGAA